MWFATSWSRIGIAISVEISGCACRKGASSGGTQTLHCDDNGMVEFWYYFYHSLSCAILGFSLIFMAQGLDNSMTSSDFFSSFVFGVVILLLSTLEL